MTKEEIKHYFNFTANALMPVAAGNVADEYLKEHKATIMKVAGFFIQKVLKWEPSGLFRGVILKEEVEVVQPHRNMHYLSFTNDPRVASHFANPYTGFGTEFFNMEQRLGKYGYVIQYTPKIEEVIFHHKLFDILPYHEAFTSLGMDGKKEVMSLMQQREIIILQPAEPFTKIQRIDHDNPTFRRFVDK